MDLERDYSPSSRAGGSAEPWIAGWERRSRRAAVELDGRVRRLADGSLVVDGGADPVGSGGSVDPLLVFVHGGYWQALSAAGSLFLATRATAEGWAFASLEYPLAPDAPIGTMVEAVRAGLTAVVDVARPGRVVLVGHSAGAHLAAMAALVEEPPVPVHRLVLLSGVYDLRPLVHTSVNEPLGLDDGQAASSSPMLLPVTVPSGMEVVVAWADHDTEAFIDQSRSFAARLGTQGLECVGRHHFDVVDDIVDPSTPLGRFTLGGGTTAPSAVAPG